MKKITLLAATVIVALSFSSCKKEYTCECSSTVPGSTTATATAEFKKKADAEAWCNQSYSSGGYTTTCKLK